MEVDCTKRVIGYVHVYMKGGALEGCEYVHFSVTLTYVIHLRIAVLTMLLFHPVIVTWGQFFQIHIRAIPSIHTRVIRGRRSCRPKGRWRAGRGSD